MDDEYTRVNVGGVGSTYLVDGWRDPYEFMREFLYPVEQSILADPNHPCVLFSNVVSNLKLDATMAVYDEVEQEEVDVSIPIPLLDILQRAPNSEIKSGFGALIFRAMHSLSPEQARVPQMKAPSVTHLIFAKGALGSTGNRSENESRLYCHEFRMFLYINFGIRTNFRRFTIPNMVCRSSLDYCVNLSKLYTENQVCTDYYPDLFPGLFFYYSAPEELHQTVMDATSSSSSSSSSTNNNSNSSGSGERKVQLLEDDLIQLHKHTTSGARNESDETVRERIKGVVSNYLPKFITVVVLVFIGGKVVGLGVKNREAAVKAFKHVSEIASKYRINEKEAAEFKRRKKAQDRLKDKNAQMEDNTSKKTVHANPFSKAIRQRIDAIPVEDEEERKERIKKILEEDVKEKEEKAKAKANGEKARRRKKGDGKRGKKRSGGGGGGGDGEDFDDIDEEEMLWEEFDMNENDEEDEVLIASQEISSTSGGVASEEDSDTKQNSSSTNTKRKDLDQDCDGYSSSDQIDIDGNIMSSLLSIAEKGRKKKKMAAAAVEEEEEEIQDMPEINL